MSATGSLLDAYLVLKEKELDGADKEKDRLKAVEHSDGLRPIKGIRHPAPPAPPPTIVGGWLFSPTFRHPCCILTLVYSDDFEYKRNHPRQRERDNRDGEGEGKKSERV